MCELNEHVNTLGDMNNTTVIIQGQRWRRDEMTWTQHGGYSTLDIKLSGPLSDDEL